MRNSKFETIFSKFLYRKDIKFIKKTVNIYTSFIEEKEFAKIVARYYVDKDKLGTVTRVFAKDIRQNKIPIYFTKYFMEKSIDEKLDCIFHELTHVYDANFLFKDIQDFRIFQIIMNSYSEYHAEKIVAMRLYGLNSINQKITKDISNVIFLNGKNKTANFHLYLKSLDALEYIQKKNIFWKNKTPDEIAIIYKQTLSYTCYFLGQLSFFKEIPGMNYQFDFNKFGVFSPDILSLWNSFNELDKDINSKTIQRVVECYDNFKNHFLQYYIKLR